MQKKIPSHCPACTAGLHITKLACDACGTEVTGCYPLPPLMRLNEEEQQLLLAFVRASGSLKSLAKEMNISYPTVRNRIDNLIERLK